MFSRNILFVVMIFFFSGCGHIVLDAGKKSQAESDIRTDGYYLFGNRKVYFYKNKKFYSPNAPAHTKTIGGYFISYHRGRGKICLVYSSGGRGSTAAYYPLTKNAKIPFLFIQTKMKPNLKKIKVRKKLAPLKIEKLI